MDIGHLPLVPSARPVLSASLWSLCFGGLSLVPFLGFILGPLAIGFGWHSRAQLKEGTHNGHRQASLGILLGVLGVGISLLSVLNFVVATSDLSGEKARAVTRDLVRNAGALELYAVVYGSYPENLSDLEDRGLDPILVDPYLYEYVYSAPEGGLKYDLRSSGPDGVRKTDDDVPFSHELLPAAGR